MVKKETTVPIEPQKESNVVADNQSIVPRLANEVLFERLKDSIVLTFLYKTGNSKIVITRVVVEVEHADKIAKSLKDMAELKIPDIS